MHQWSYAIVYYDREAKVWLSNGEDITPRNTMIEALNAMGRRGWEMAANEPFQHWTVGGEHRTSTASFYFKRPISVPGDGGEQGPGGPVT